MRSPDSRPHEVDARTSTEAGAACTRCLPPPAGGGSAVPLRSSPHGSRADHRRSGRVAHPLHRHTSRPRRSRFRAGCDCSDTSPISQSKSEARWRERSDDCADASSACRRFTGRVFRVTLCPSPWPCSFAAMDTPERFWAKIRDVIPAVLRKISPNTPNAFRVSESREKTAK